MYDDFGRVHIYLEDHRGATMQQVAQATGVSMDSIRQFLRDDRIEIIEGSGVLLYCEICRAPIRSGRFCESCQKRMHRVITAVCRDSVWQKKENRDRKDLQDENNFLVDIN